MPSKVDYNNKKVLVLGLGISGCSAVKFLLKRGAIVTAVDRNADALITDELLAFKQLGLKALHDSQLDLRDHHFDLVVTSPGIPPTDPLYRQAISAGIEMIGEVELACRSITQKCLAVTGTNGKTSVTLMVAHVLNHAGISARALGNVGIPLSSAIDQNCLGNDEIFVIELSSFQIDTLRTRFIDAGVVLNITHDHLDRYGNLENYARSKASLGDYLKPQGKFFVEDKCLKEFFQLFANRNIYSYGYDKNCFIHTDLKTVFLDQTKVFDLPLSFQGKPSHDLENLMAAFSLSHYAGVAADQFCDAIRSFQKPAHRIEFIRTIDGVHFYDDSKGTNIDAVVRALETLEGQVILIAGGVDKGASYTPWQNTIANKLKLICAIGKAKEKIKSELGDQIPVLLFETLDDAVIHAANVSTAGDTVLLSPGCSSYDMFKDYKHRGEEFQRIVKGL